MEQQTECIIRGESNIKQKRKDIECEERIINVFNERENYDILDFLRAMAHNLKF